MKLIATVVVYNEEQHIPDLLHSLQRIVDLDDVYILDGKYGDKEIPSDDKTKEIVTSSKVGLFKTHWLSAQHWADESIKRNWLWKFLDKTIKDDCWYLIIDGDEEIITENNSSIELKPALQQIEDDFVILESGPHNENIDFPLEYFQVRLIRGNKNIHWYTGDVMVVHNTNCKVLMDYGRGYLCQPYGWIKNMMLLNKWLLRPKEKTTSIKKLRRETKVKGGKCEFRPI